jgi:hypothetical protein
MLRLNPYWSMSLTLHMSPTVSELMHIISHNLLSNERMQAHPCCTHPQVKDMYHKIRSINDAAMNS